MLTIQKGQTEFRPSANRVLCLVRDPYPRKSCFFTRPNFFEFDSGKLKPGRISQVSNAVTIPTPPLS